MSQLHAAVVERAERMVRRGPVARGVSADDVADLIAVLSPEQAELVVGLDQASDFVRSLLASRLPQGTRELLVTHDAIDESGQLTSLGLTVASHLAFAANRGPDPRLLASAEAMEVPS
jgi:hypothetical protein